LESNNNIGKSRKGRVNILKKKTKEVLAAIYPLDVVEQFEVFIRCHRDFRKYFGLKNKIANIHEILVAMTDKHGRICRYIKHQERKDPKDNWKSEIISSLTGYIVYALMLMEYYRIDISEGMEKELNEAIKQHGKKK